MAGRKFTKTCNKFNTAATELFLWVITLGLCTATNENCTIKGTYYLQPSLYVLLRNYSVDVVTA